jgi:hypothetical protein
MSSSPPPTGSSSTAPKVFTKADVKNYPEMFRDVKFGGGAPFENPVYLPEERDEGLHCTYEAKYLKEHFDILIAKNEQLVSPHGTTLTGTEVLPDLILINEMEMYIQTELNKMWALAQEDTGTMYAMGSCLTWLDDHREVLSSALEGWQPPCVILLGAEQTGLGTNNVLRRFSNWYGFCFVCREVISS